MIRPSSMPKLAACPQYEGSQTPSPAAERGTRVDAIFRERIERGIEHGIEHDNEEAETAQWASDYVRNRCGFEEVYVHEVDCRVGAAIDGLELVGTMDAVCPTMHLLFDLKTGEIRNYREQMAAYALACMETFHATEWTAVIVFADQREIREHRFRREDAEEIVRQIIQSRTVENPQPIVCEYCSWCSKFSACQAVTASANLALGLVPDADRFQRAIATPDGLAAFLNGARIVEEWAEAAKFEAKKRIMAGETVPGWKVQSWAGRSRVAVDQIMSHPDADIRKLLPKTVSEKTAREALPNLPASLIERGEGTIALTQTKGKK